jgi:phosphoribosyl 1,2-cyclic phosphodiesterase
MATMTFMHHETEIEPFALSKEQVLAARAADTGPRTAPLPPEHVTCARAGALRLDVLGSGSKGNCSLVRTEKTAVMVDCGFSARNAMKLLDRAGIDEGTIAAIVLTHEHTDHLSGVDVLSRKLDVPIYTAEGTASVPKVAKMRNVMAIPHRSRLTVGDIDIATFPTSHDAADPIGLRFECAGDSLGYATDTGVLSDEARELLAGCRILALESNHDPRMLKEGPYPSYLKTRIAGDSGHLSNTQARDALEELLSDSLCCVVGMHLSQVNNLPGAALASLQDAIDRNAHPARAAVASQGRILLVD